MDFLTQFTEESERIRLDEIRERSNNILEEIKDNSRNNESNPPELSQEFNSLQNEENEIISTIEARYIKKKSLKAIYEDIEAVLKTVSKEDFKIYLERIRNAYSVILSEYSKEEAENKINKEELQDFKSRTAENYENCCRYLLMMIRLQVNALEAKGEDLSKALSIVGKYAQKWYIEKTPALLPMVHGKATDAIAFMSGRRATIDPITQDATLKLLGVKLIIAKMGELRASLGISTNKLLSYALTMFTKNNSFPSDSLNCSVSFPLKEYATLIGYDVEEHETETPEEEKKEKKRVKNQLDNARKAITKDLYILQSSWLSWKETIRKNEGDFVNISLITSTAIQHGQILIRFSPDIASYLSDCNYITYYPTKLLKLDNRKKTANLIGLKLYEYYNIDRNEQRKTNDRISIPSLLAITDLASYEEIQKTDRGHWIERIKEPLKKALDTLIEEDLLKDWRYTHAKGVELTEEEAYNITSYEEFSKLYLRFTPSDTIDKAERLHNKMEAKKKAQEKKSNKKR